MDAHLDWKCDWGNKTIQPKGGYFSALADTDEQAFHALLKSNVTTFFVIHHPLACLS